MEYNSIVGFNGINRSVSPFLSEPGDLLDVQNYSANKIGVLNKSFDYTIKGAQIVDAAVLGGVDFFRNDGTHEHIVAVNGTVNSDLYKYSGSWVSQSQSLDNDNKVRFAYSPTIDTLFAVNYANATRSYDGSSWSTATNVTDAPKAKIAIAFGERIHLLNCKVGSTEYPSRDYYCNQIETGATWDPNDYNVFNDVIVGAGYNADTMFVVCQSSTHILTSANTSYQMSQIGGVSHESIVSHGSYTFYAARSGFYAFDGKETFKVSMPIQPYWDNIPEASLSEIQAVVDGDHIYVYVGDIVAPWSTSETLDNVIFDYNILQNNWHRGRLSTNCTHLHNYVTTGGQEVFMGDSNGKIYQMFDGSGQQGGADYESSIETNWDYGSGAGHLDDFQELWGYGHYLSGLKVSYKTEERQEWVDVGELNEDSSAVMFKTRAYKIKFRLSEYSGKNLFEVDRLDIGYMPAYKRDADRKGRFNI